MYGLGIILLVELRTGSYFQAGLVTAAFAVAAAVCQPITARWADQFGQDKILPAQTTLHVLTLVTGIFAVILQWPLLVTLVIFAMSGAATPSVGALVRSRWVYVTKSSRQFHSALALESVADEVIFVIGPVVATVLVLNVSDVMGLAVAAVLVSVGVLFLVPQRATQPPLTEPITDKTRHLLTYPSFFWVLAIAVCAGGVFGSFEVSTVAFAEEGGFPEATGFIIASYAAGSLIAGLVFGSLHPKGWIVKRYALAIAALAVFAVPLPFVDNGYVLGVAVFVAGFTIAPVLITSYAVIERLVEDRRLTEGFTWFTSGLGIGLAGSAALAGALIDDYGASSGYVVLVACGVGAAIAIWAGFGSLARALPRASDTPAPATGGVSA